MKKNIYAANFMKMILGAILLVALTGCNSKVDQVKNGVLNFDKSKTVGEAFDNYKYFDSTNWDAFESEDGRNIVEVDAKFNDEYMKLMGWKDTFKSAYLIVQFVLNKDNTFKISYIGLKAKLKDGEVKEVNLGKGMNLFQLNIMLQQLYNNEPLT